MEKAFQGQNIYVGIDVHKKSWTVSIIGDYNEFRTFVQPPYVDTLYNYLQNNFPGANL